MPAPNTEERTLVRLSCVDDDAQGQSLEVLWENELDAEIRNGENWQLIAQRGFDPAKQFAAYLNTLRWNCVTSTDSRLLQSPFRAGIRLDPYQLEPLRKALRLPRVNLFIADDVGLGKTIEAGLIARELLLRKKIKEIVVSCPPSMLLQWQPCSLRRDKCIDTLKSRPEDWNRNRCRGRPWLCSLPPESSQGVSSAATNRPTGYDGAAAGSLPETALVIVPDSFADVINTRQVDRHDSFQPVIPWWVTPP